MPSTALTIDARGLRCPLPVLRAEKALAGAAPGVRILVLATDPMARIDIPLHCRKHGHACVVGEEDEGVLVFSITKAGAETPA